MYQRYITIRNLKSLYSLADQYHCLPRPFSNISLPMSAFQVSEEVQHALSTHQPIVALESTIITHGMPHPVNLETCRKVESIIRAKCVLPATIAVLAGKICVGLSDKQLEQLVDQTASAVKTSRRNFSFVIAKGLTGGTTVCGTMVIAQRLSIPVFVTGGIGGVHRGAENSMDVSADLTELGRSPIAVVCAGVKSILDVGRTLEYLETQGVCVCVIGDTPQFPDFFTRDSGYTAPCHVTNATEAAKMIQANFNLGLDSGMLFAVPIPEQFEADGRRINEAIEQAVKEAEILVSGAEVTPFILNRVAELTKGESLNSNIALIENNASVGAEVALELSKLRSSSGSLVPPSNHLEYSTTGHDISKKPIVRN